MSLHKLTAGDGYTYLTRQVAAHDATDRGYDNLGAYYSEKGEAPGVWMGRGLATVPDFPVGTQVTEAQMVALFGEGRHPNADQIERALRAAGASEKEIDRGSRLGSPYRIFEQANMFHRRCAGAFRDYNTARGLAADTPVPPDERARIRTELARSMFLETYGRPAADARELSGHLARISRQATTAVAGYDLTFSPVKSVSTLWAIAPREVATQIETAHDDAVTDTLRWLEDNVAFTRRGRNGVAQVEVRGLIAAAFTHRDSRAGDPDLHTHVAVSNKVQTLDGHWLALDGRGLFKNNVAASERYNTRLQALLVQRLGLSFAVRPEADPAKRPVYEIVGVDGDLPRRWSSRRASIDLRRAVLSARFQTDHGRPPTPKEAVSLAEQANKETRQAKHEPRSHAEQRATWRAEAVAVLGGETGLRSYLRGALAHRKGPAEAPRVTDRWVQQTAAQVLSTVASSRAVWQEHHIRAEAERQARAAGVGLTDLDQAVNAVVQCALSPGMSMRLDTREPVTEMVTEPAALRRSDGASVYTVAGSTLYTCAEILAAEKAIVAAAGRRDGRTVPAKTVDVALLEATANGVQLNPGQVQLVRELAGSGARVQLALAPAGTGKTTAMRLLSRSWTTSGGHVIGLAPSSAAAAVLRDEIGAHTDTLAKLTWHLTNGNGGPEGPAWVDRIGPDTLVVIDEAGMAGTIDLAATISYVTDRGGSVRLIGDDQQLAAVGAGGVLRDLAAVHGAVTLSEVVRFTDPDTGTPNHAEGATSLALRDGDPAAIAYYLDNRRVHVGDPSTVADHAYTAWAADRVKGRDALMLAPTRELVAQLNDRAREDRLAAQSALVGRQVSLADQSQASAGDTVITRANNRRIPVTATDWVKNGDRWTVETVHESGALDVVQLRTGRRLTLPADYVAQHVSLGYAATVHAAQGVTADTCHAVATGDETRQQLYVAMTRGRHANHLHLATAVDGDPHSVITRDALLSPTAGDVLARMLARDGAPVSATSQTRALAEPATRLRAAADQYHHALGTAAEDRLGPAGLAAIDLAAEALLPGLTGHDAYPTLRAHLALGAVDGQDPETVLRAALNSYRGLGDAHDMAAVLDWRLNPRGHGASAAGPLPWLPAVPTTLAGDTAWGSYLCARSDQVAKLATAVATRTRTWTPTSAPAWATPLIEDDPDLVADLAIWRAAHGIDDHDHRPTGTAMPGVAKRRAQRRLNHRVTRQLGDPHAVTARWKPLGDSIDPRITSDPYWPTLADRLAIAERAGIDITNLTRAVGTTTPLPDEQPAAALWWRLSRHLSPAAMAATDHSVTHTLRPAWTPALADVIGTEAAARVLADPSWPALVAAITRAQTCGWEPRQVLDTAQDLLRGGQPDDQPLRHNELATALVWRIRLLTDAAPAGLDDNWADTMTEPEDLGEDYPDHEDTYHQPISERTAPPDDALTTTSTMPHHCPTDIAGDAAVDHRATHVRVSRDRILELNQQAANFFAARYAGSGASRYLAGRLGTDLADDERFTLGYAPASWTALTRHLRRNGATEQEIVAAGLGSYATTGRVIDRFRDRLMFAIKDPDGIHGFIGRRNPATTDDENAGPKYLNTGTNDLFIKGHEMYGLTEGAAALAAGATAVLVEGPIDALAVTIAGNGDYVGVAPLGTALTDTQVDRLAPYLGAGPAGLIMATDADRAGQQAAHRAFWQLAARGDNPRHLVMAGAKDPAELLQTAGAAALRDALMGSGSLADTVIAARTAQYTNRLDTAEGIVFATRRAAEVIAALPSDSWPVHLTRTVARTGVSPDIAVNELLNARQAWTDDPREQVRKHLGEQLRQPTLQAPRNANQPRPPHVNQAAIVVRR